MAELGWVRHAFLTRQGGVSIPPYDSLNMSDKNGDREDFVSENKNRIATAFRFDSGRLILLDQMQQDQILLMREPVVTLPSLVGDSLAMSLRGSETTEAISQDIENTEIAAPACRNACHEAFQGQQALRRAGTLPLVARNDKKEITKRFLEYDAMVTNSPDIFLGILTADCLPIFAIDQKRKVIAAIHAGRQGTSLRITAKVLKKMKRDFACSSRDFLISLGPSIGPCCYEIDEEVFHPDWKPFSTTKGAGKVMVDLAQINIAQMKSEGIKEEQISWINLCTRCHADLFFSYRGEGRTGRQLSFIGIVE
jgi:YfiH family protein